MKVGKIITIDLDFFLGSKLLIMVVARVGLIQEGEVLVYSNEDGDEYAKLHGSLFLGLPKTKNKKKWRK